MEKVFIHKLADVQSKNIGEGSQIWQFAVILEGAVIGKDCNINCHTFIENEVILGDRVTIKSGIYLWNGVEISNDVFLGPGVSFINDKYPRSKQFLENAQKTKIGEFVSVGANATILPGITIGKYALIGAGSVVTKDVAPYALVLGNPAGVAGKVNEAGEVIERFKKTI